MHLHYDRVYNPSVYEKSVECSMENCEVRVKACGLYSSLAEVKPRASEQRLRKCKNKNSFR